MNKCYKIVEAENNMKQAFGLTSYIGGKPSLPASFALPRCRLCGSEQTFFLQVAFPADHPWHGKSLAVFACTACADKNYRIPPMLETQLKAVDIPDGFLNDYQVNFHFVVFDTATATLRTDAQEKIKFKGLHLKPVEDLGVPGNKLGGIPNWVLDDESPATYRSAIPMFFLLQLEQDFRFEKTLDSPPQMRIGLSGKPEPALLPDYKLFLGNALFLFGTNGSNQYWVYAITQVD